MQFSICALSWTVYKFRELGRRTEGWYGEGGGRRVQDGEHMYACGGFIWIYGRTNTIL